MNKIAPIRTYGEVETRMLSSSMQKLSESEYFHRKDQLGKLLVKTGHFKVEQDWSAILSGLVGDLVSKDIQLPFPCCTFELLFLEAPMIITVKQNDVTHEVVIETVEPVDNYTSSDITYEELLSHVFYICLALEIKLASKVKEEPQSFRPSYPGERVPGDIYKVLIIKPLESKDTSSDGSPSGRKQRLHFRRGHWRVRNGVRIRVKWCFAGDISLGTVIKDYQIK